MSASNPSDPRMLLPDWLRDGDTPIPAPIEPPAPVAVAEVVDIVEVAQAVEIPVAPADTPPAVPYSDRLSLDTRLDPGLLVAPEDLPTWLGGLERTAPLAASAAVAAAPQTPVAPRVVDPAPTLVIDEPEPYEGVDAPEPGVIDVDVNGWYVLAAAVGLLILLAAALKLYLS